MIGDLVITIVCGCCLNAIKKTNVNLHCYLHLYLFGDFFN